MPIRAAFFVSVTPFVWFALNAHALAAAPGMAALAGGAMGDMASLRGALSHYPNLAGMVSHRRSISPVSQGLAAPRMVSRMARFADGSRLAFFRVQDDAVPDAAFGNSGNAWAASYTMGGTSLSAGTGFAAAPSFAEALWGQDDGLADAAALVSASMALMARAPGGNFVTFGDRAGGLRMAFSWSQSQASTLNGNQAFSRGDWAMARASAYSAGISGRLASFWQAGITAGALDEDAGLLGTTYAANGPLDFGGKHRSLSAGLSTVFSLGGRRQLLLDAALARSEGAAGGGLVENISTLYAASYGAALADSGVMREGDRLFLSIAAPLRVVSGTAQLWDMQHVNLAPRGREVSFLLGYDAPVTEKVSWSATANARRDADHVRGLNDISFLLGAQIRF